MRCDRTSPARTAVSSGQRRARTASVTQHHRPSIEPAPFVTRCRGWRGHVHDRSEPLMRRVSSSLRARLGAGILIVSALGAASCDKGPKSGKVLDEAMRANRTAASFPAADEDYFHDMDGALPLSR